MFYLDTSFIVAALTQDEYRSDDARLWLGAALPSTLVISDWVKTETSSAFSAKIRLGKLNLEQRAAALLRWRLFQTESLTVIAVRPDDIETATSFAERHELSLRAGDALHIAIARGAGLQLVTLDKRMAKAAVELGVPVAELTVN